MRSPRTKILLPYYGKWPPYFRFYLEGCRRNPGFDFHFFTDCPAPAHHSSNVTFTHLSLGRLVALARTATGAAVPAIRPYKLCDLKPAYGVMFAEHLKGYDYWGYGDIDVIYGDLSRFLLPDALGRYDVISCRREWVSGSLALFRNDPRVNRLYETSRSFPAVFESKHNWMFDECCGNHYAALMNGAEISQVDPLESMTWLILRPPARARSASPSRTASRSSSSRGGS